MHKSHNVNTFYNERNSFPSTSDFYLMNLNNIKDLTNDVSLDNPNLLEFVKKFNKYGFVILNLEQVEKNDMIQLHRLFGTIYNHEKADENGIARIEDDPKSGNIPAEEYHLPHTDETYCDVTSRILAMLCEVSTDEGGESLLISGKTVHDYVKTNYPNELDYLYAPNCLTVGRQLPDCGMKKATFPIFKVIDNSANMKFRSIDSYVIEILPEAENILRKTDNFVNDPKNQLVLRLLPNQMIILDNRGIIHGRTPYDKRKPRRLWRTNYYNDGPLKDVLFHGVPL